ncbi:ABC-type transport system permease protein (probable substrate phosphate/phosphonate) (plasmid) [Natronomonas pharaonis DSM 2160]|uniref:ABC-type transport system permease protein (Probable substrate phosphate/phosphonate) n=1 Tax=Natronomonas pharaonis (strain ATCC 35678 / DSM 2160 / CIP 103997 / JCM 8858 / NBRC 14720 / NCIMB 2260 / Gabara) TaxID=348780 RepID=Q3IM25_NATPD|nr:phosphonate ABC transporter, permease protein PhnE [Natronomonas pharaonis]CAI50841.1 ABC-type transport system permease protein (probable substrate phosphate/phosphonate) [Natronomonas pharaonis DSM 2160]
MTADTGHDDPDGRTWQRPTVFGSQLIKYAVYLLVVVFFAWNVFQLRISLDRLLLGFSEGQTLLTRMLTLEGVGRHEISVIISGTIETLAMSVVATIIGVAISIPIGFLAARNVSPLLSYLLGRGMITFSRAFHGLVFAIIAVKAFGFGPFAGVVTLVFTTVGFYSKLLADELEDIDQGQIDAIRATGGSRMDVILYGFLPQVLPRMVGLAIYRWDINIRSASIIGIVGAGGLGQVLLTSFERFDYGFSMAIIISIIAIVMAGEIISSTVRRRIQ